MKFVSVKSKSIKDDINLISQFFDCSYGRYGLMYKLFISAQNDLKSKVVYCLDKNQVIGWGLRYKDVNHHEVMLYVDKDYRRKGIGTKIYNKLVIGLSKDRISNSAHNVSARKFFNSVK